MHKLFLTIGLTLLPLFSHAEWGMPDWCNPAASCRPDIQDASILVATGYRQDNFNWNIAGPKGHPDVLSELDWKNLSIWTVDGKIDMVLCNNVYLRANGTWGKIFRGKVRDSDWLFDDRTFEFSRSTSQAGRGCVYDISGAIGYRFCYVDGALFITPLAGYSYDAQHLHMFDGLQEINIDLKTLQLGYVGEFPGLNSTYKARWSGPWIGLDLQWNVNLCFNVFAEYEYHWAHYRGTGDWNLRADLPHGFNHHARGKGHVLKAGASYEFCNGWSWGLGAEYQAWRTYKGWDKTDVYEPNTDLNGDFTGVTLVSVRQRLNRVHWRSIAYTANISYDY